MIEFVSWRESRREKEVVLLVLIAIRIDAESEEDASPVSEISSCWPANKGLHIDRSPLFSAGVVQLATLGLAV